MLSLKVITHVQSSFPFFPPQENNVVAKILCQMIIFNLGSFCPKFRSISMERETILEECKINSRKREFQAITNIPVVKIHWQLPWVFRYLEQTLR